MTEISKTADKALAILAELARSGPSSPQQLSQSLGINRTVAQRLLMTLLSRDFVARTGGEYSLSPHVRRLADSVFPELRATIRRIDEGLAATTGETVVFQVIDDDSVIVVDEAISPAPVALKARHGVGSRSPITESASGLAILAAMSEAEIRRVLGSRAVADEELRTRLGEIREAGYAVTSSELQAGVTGIARAVRLPDRVGGSVAILLPSERADDLTEVSRQLSSAVDRVVRELSVDGA